jgi:competence protein ComEA
MFAFFKSLAVAVLLLASPLLMAEIVDINTASSDELSKALKGVGPAKAQAIVQYREKNGPFKSADDLTHVKGIGKATLEKNRANITISGSAPPAAPAPAVAPKLPVVPAPSRPVPAIPAPAPAAPH